MNHKSALRVMLMEGMTMVPNGLRLSSAAGTTTLSPLYSYATLLMPTV